MLAALALGATIPGSAQRLHVDDYGVQDGLPSARVRAIEQGADGRLWIAGPAGAAAYDGGRWIDYGLSAGLRWGDQARLLWSGDELIAVSHQPPYPPSVWQPRAESGVWRATPGPGDLAQDAVLLDVTATPVAGGPLIYATDRGLLVQGPPVQGHDGWVRYSTADGLPSDRVHAAVSWHGKVLLATDAGFAWLDGRRIRAFEDSMVDRAVLALAKVPSRRDSLRLVGDGWIGTLSETGFELMGDDLPFRARQGRPVHAVDDGLGGVYVCGVEAVASWLDAKERATGLVYFHPRIGLQPLGPRHGIETGEVASLFVDRESNVWVGGERGLAKIVSRRLTTWDRRVGLLDDEVFSALQRGDGSVLLGHRGGLSILRPSGARTVVDTRSLPLSSPDQRRIEPVRDIEEDGDGVVWLAAESAGVLALPTLVSVPRRYGPAAGIEGDATALVVGGERVWVGTDRGVFVSRPGRQDFVPAGGPGDVIHVRQMAADGDAVLVASASGVHRLTRSGRRSWASPDWFSHFATSRVGGGWRRSCRAPRS